MKLLFDKQGAIPEEELRELIPVIDADLKFKKIRPDIITATNEMVRLVGQPFYELVFEKYEEENTEDSFLVYCVRYPIAVKAYSLFAPNNDIAHTPNGRKMRNDKNEKLPFEWMVNADNEAWERRYYRALDDMLIYLQDNEAWKNTDAFKSLNSLFITNTDDFDKFFRIQSRYVLLSLMPGIRQCEQREIKSRIGKTRFDELKSKLTTGTDLNDEEKELLELIQEACVFYAMAWAMTRLSVTIFPEGVLQAYTSDRDTIKIKQPAQKLEVTAAQKAFTADANEIFARIEDFVRPATPVAVPGSSPTTMQTYIEGSNFLSL